MNKTQVVAVFIKGICNVICFSNLFIEFANSLNVLDVLITTENVMVSNRDKMRVIFLKQQMFGNNPNFYFFIRCASPCYPRL